MTNTEFRDEFDVLYNNITSNQAPGLDDYEKSVFLTKAQYEIVYSYFNPKSNKTQEGYDGSEKRQIDFSAITKASEYTDFENALLDDKSNSKSVTMPTDVMMIVNEFVTVNRNNRGIIRLVSIPLDYTSYVRFSSKPFKRPLKFQAWRLINNDGSNKADLVVDTNDVITKYSIRYVKRPNPIVIGDLDGVSIEGVSTNTECELDPIIHREILQRAIELAEDSYKAGLGEQVSLGLNSQTAVGMVTSQK